MAKKVLIISTSLRGGSNSDILANECAKGAKEAGHDVELLSLKGKDIKYCIGCLSCQRNGMCVLKDDVADIMAKVKDAEVIVYATPIYYYEMCASSTISRFWNLPRKGSFALRRPHLLRRSMFVRRRCALPMKLRISSVPAFQQSQWFERATDERNPDTGAQRADQHA